MSTTGNTADQVAPAPATPPPVYLDAREEFAAHFLVGEGLEIGPLHQPLALPPHAGARYVDRMGVDELRSEYPELADWNLTQVDIVDDGETLGAIAEESQDFIVANHFLEHTENPIKTIETHLGKLKPGGILFYAVPDKRFTFDFRRPPTPLEHMVADYEQGPERSRAEHYLEWCRLVPGQDGAGDDGERPPEESIQALARKLDADEYSIHMHVWTQAKFLKLILECRARFNDGFDIEAAARQTLEFVVVLRKAGSLPAPTPNALPLSGSQELKNASRKAVEKARREIQRRRAKS